MAHKMAAGSADNLKTSNPKYRGVKRFGGQIVRAGEIIIRQKGSKYRLGDNVGEGRDRTIYAQSDGVVKFFKKRVKKFNGRIYVRTFVSVAPVTA